MNNLSPSSPASRRSRWSLACMCLAVGLLLHLSMPLIQGGELVLYSDNFESYAVGDPAANPLTGGPAGGQWYFVDPKPPMTPTKHRIFQAGTGGSGLNSRCWISLTNYASLTNAIVLHTLPSDTNVAIFRLKWLAAGETGDASQRDCIFRYDICSSAGSLGFLYGGNLDNSQILTNLNGYARAIGGTRGKANMRKFQAIFCATNLTVGDTINFSYTFITNTMLIGWINLDDVSLEVSMGLPGVQAISPSATYMVGETVSLSGTFTNGVDAYQWYKDGQPIAGATASGYTIPFVTKPDEGSYVLWATNLSGYASTPATVVSVTDNGGPTIESASGLLTLSHLRVRFNEPVVEKTATNLANYSFTGGALTVANAHMIDRFTVELFTSAMTPGGSYTVNVTGVKDLADLVTPGSSFGFTAPALVVSALRYDAGNTITQPEGPADPASPEGNFWQLTTNLNNGMLVGPVMNDMDTGLNAWQVTDMNVLSSGGVLDYRIPIDQASDNLARSNGWRFLVYARLADSFGGTSPDHLMLYADTGTGLRYGIFFSMDIDGRLMATPLGGSAYFLTDDALSYHLHVLVFDPATARASYYFDGRLIFSNYAGQSATGYNGVIFGSASSTGTGQMNYNLVQFDVMNGGRPQIVAQPQDSVNGVGQKVTFTAGFTPFVGAYQWFSNNVAIPGAIGVSYTTDFITMGYNGAQYKCRALHALGNVETLPATLTVTTDTTPPQVAGVYFSLLLDRVTIAYTEPVQEQYATNIANYSWVNPGLATLSARMVDPATVELRTTPQQMGSNYTVRINNVRDTSNLAIAANTPASFTNPWLEVLARYYAGTTADAPAGPPDPTSSDGGNWILHFDDDPDLSTNAVVDDMGTGWNAWAIRDASIRYPFLVSYTRGLSTNSHMAAKQYGWVITVRSRMAEDFGTSFTMCAQYADHDFYRNVLFFDLNAGNDLTVDLAVASGLTNRVLTTWGVGSTDYHLHQVAFDPFSTRTSYYFDGECLASGWSTSYSVTATPGLLWGAGSSANKGAMNFNLVEFKTVAAPFVELSCDGENVNLQYRGVLEAASELGNPTAWGAVVTNATSGATVYSVPRTSQAQQYFRARLLP